MNLIIIVLFAFAFCVIDAQVQLPTSLSNQTDSNRKDNAPKCAENGEYVSFYFKLFLQIIKNVGTFHFKIKCFQKKKV